MAKLGAGVGIKQSFGSFEDLSLLTGTTQSFNTSVKALLETNMLVEPDLSPDSDSISLDEVKDQENESYLEDDIYGYKSQSEGGNAPDFSEMPPADKISLEEELHTQLEMSMINKDSSVYMITKRMISDLDESGFLVNVEGSVRSFNPKLYADRYLFATGEEVTEKEVLDSQNVLKQLGDKVGLKGIGCSTTHECLLHQVKGSRSPVHYTAEIILTEHFTELIKGEDFLDKLKAKNPLSIEYFPEAISFIEKLNPSPGNRDSNKMAQSHVKGGTTFVVNIYDGSYETKSKTINKEFDSTVSEERTRDYQFETGISPKIKIAIAPDQLRIVEEFKEKSKNGELAPQQESDYSQLKTHLSQAKKYIKLQAMRERLDKVILDVITKRQLEYLITNDPQKLKATNFQDLNELVVTKMRDLQPEKEFSISESTLRNYVRDNTLQANHGIYTLKDLIVDENSLRKIQARPLISDLIDKENSLTPLSDSDIAKLVSKQSKTTFQTKNVSDYRSEMKIPSALVRKAKAMVSGNTLGNKDTTEHRFIYEKIGEVLAEESRMSPLRDFTIAHRINKLVKEDRFDAKQIKQYREEFGIPDQNSRAVIYSKERTRTTNFVGVNDFPLVESPINIPKEIDI